MNLVMFGEPSAWDGPWYSRHQLTAGLARRHRVFIVRDPGDWRCVVKNPRLLLRRARIEGGPSGVVQYAPPGWLPEIYRWNPLRRILTSLRCRSLVRTLRTERAIPAVYYVWLPDHQEAVEGLVGSPLVYHCYDRYEHYTDVPQAVVRRQESWLARRAAVCIAASVKIGEHLNRLGAREVIVLRHGVDHTRFRPDVPTHSALRDIRKPRLGLVASLTDAVDVRTLLQVARQKPDWSLVIVGGVYFTKPEKLSTFEALCRLPNVYHAGLRPQAEIPAWIDGFDVSLTCYDITTWAPYNQPLKMYEYLACGVPVVSSDIEAAQELGDLVARAAEPDQWVPTIERVLAQNGPAQIERRVAFARANSWEQRVAELEGVLLRVVGARR